MAPLPAAGAGGAGYRVVGPYYVPAGAAGARLYWRHVHRPQCRRGAALARLAALWPQPALLGHPSRRLEWAAAVEASLRERLGGNWECVWRPAAPGVSRTALGWIGSGSHLLALARVAFGEQATFLRREQQALEFLVDLPTLAASTPRLLGSVADSERSLLLIENACRGHPATPASLERQDLCAAATWLAHFQTATANLPDSVTVGNWREPLHAAICAHTGLLAPVRVRLLQRLQAVEVPRLTAAHGDFWWGNLLWDQPGRVAVVDWTEFRRLEHPLHDAAFFLLTLARDLSPREQRAVPALWLDRAFTPGTPFHTWARRWFDLYQWDTGWTVHYENLLAYLPLAMARYACFGQQSARWTAACNSGAWR